MGASKNIRKILEESKIQWIDLRFPVFAKKSDSLKDVLKAMTLAKRGSVIIMDGHKIIGIFTERDALTRAAEKKIDYTTPIEKLMTPMPKTLPASKTIAEAIQMMNEGGYRRLPLEDESGNIHGLLSARDLLKYFAEQFPYQVYNLPPNPNQVMTEAEGA